MPTQRVGPVDPLPAAGDEAALGRVDLAARNGVGPRERLGVRLRPDRHLGVEAVDLAQGQLRDELALGCAALGDQDLGEAFERDVCVRVRAALDRGPVDSTISGVAASPALMRSTSPSVRPSE